MIPIVDPALRFRRFRYAALAAGALFAAGAPRRAAADIPGTNVDFMYYGRMGIAWTPSGQVVAGKYMNLGDHKAIGGRLEEGDYLEPGIRYHIKKAQKDGDTTIDLVNDYEIFTFNGALLSDTANGNLYDIRILPLHAIL